MKNKLIEHNGSVQELDIPDNLKQIYKTAFEISPKSIIQMARDRQYFVDQSQSMNLFIGTPSVSELAKIHMYSWKQGLKTGIYYLRTKPAVNAVKVTLAPLAPAAERLPPKEAAAERLPPNEGVPSISMAKTTTRNNKTFICNLENEACFTCTS
jgi:ribonucleotide reductase alpha subunit